MSSQEVKTNPWPGFVAAISGLVASLMLLLAVLVLLLSQLGALAANYAQKLLADALRRADEMEAVAAIEKIRGTGVGPGLGGAKVGVSPVPIDPSPKISEVVLLFGGDVNDIPEEQRPLIGEAMRELRASAQAKWRIVASAPVADRVLRRSTFRLMVVVRNFAIAQGIAESRIEMRLEDGPVATGPAPEGSIVVRLVPSRVEADAPAKESSAPAGPADTLPPDAAGAAAGGRS